MGRGTSHKRCRKQDRGDRIVIIVAVLLIAFGVMLLTAALVSCCSRDVTACIKASGAFSAESKISENGIFKAVWVKVEGLFPQKPIIMIDAGHGGIDGGAVSADGVSEKDINLSIALMVEDILAGWDAEVVQTRTGDEGVGGAAGDGSRSNKKQSIRSIKTEDLRTRREMADDLRPDAFVSIHLNSFKEDRTVYGAQTFYSDGDTEEAGTLSRKLAETIQSHIELKIDNGSVRVPLEKKDVLMLKQTAYPAVIVECGFLSNSNEAELLQTYDYQYKMAEAIAEGIADFLELEKKMTVVKSK